MDTVDKINLENEDKLKVKQTRTKRVLSKDSKTSTTPKGGSKRKKINEAAGKQDNQSNLWNTLGMNRKDVEKVHEDFLKTLNIDPKSFSLSDVMKDCEKYGIDGIFKRLGELSSKREKKIFNYF